MLPFGCPAKAIKFQGRTLLFFSLRILLLMAGCEIPRRRAAADWFPSVLERAAVAMIFFMSEKDGMFSISLDIGVHHMVSLFTGWRC